MSGVCMVCEVTVIPLLLFFFDLAGGAGMRCVLCDVCSGTLCNEWEIRSAQNKL